MSFNPDIDEVARYYRIGAHFAAGVGLIYIKSLTPRGQWLALLYQHGFKPLGFGFTPSTIHHRALGLMNAARAVIEDEFCGLDLVDKKEGIEQLAICEVEHAEDARLGAYLDRVFRRLNMAEKQYLSIIDHSGFQLENAPMVAAELNLRETLVVEVLVEWEKAREFAYR